MNIETTVFTFKLSNTFEEWVKTFDSPEIDAFHKKVGLTPLYRGKSLINPKEVIVIHQAEEGVPKHIFYDPETIWILRLEVIFIALQKSQVGYQIE